MLINSQKSSWKFSIYEIIALIYFALYLNPFLSVGLKPFVQGLLLWIVISIGSLLYILW